MSSRDSLDIPTRKPRINVKWTFQVSMIVLGILGNIYHKIFYKKVGYIGIAICSIFIVILFYISSSIWIFLLILACLCIGVFTGMLVGFGSTEDLVSSRVQNDHLKGEFARWFHQSLLPKEFHISDIKSPLMMASEGNLTSQLHSLDIFSPKIKELLYEIISCFMRDFVDSWYSSIDTSQKRIFQIQIERLVSQAILSIYRMTKGRLFDIVTLMSYGLLNALIIEIRAFRQFESVLTAAASFTPHSDTTAQLQQRYDLNAYLRDYISAKKDDPFWRSMSYSTNQELSYLNNYVSIWINKLLPLSEMSYQYSCQRIFLEEVLSTQFLYPIIQWISDPFWINKLVIYVIKQRYLKLTIYDSPQKLAMMELRIKLLQVQNIPYLETSEFYLVFSINGMKKKRTRTLNVYTRSNKTEPLFFKLMLSPATQITIEFIMSVTDSTDICLAIAEETLSSKDILPMKPITMQFALKPISSRYFQGIGNDETKYITIHTELSMRDIMKHGDSRKIQSKQSHSVYQKPIKRQNSLIQLSTSKQSDRQVHSDVEEAVITLKGESKIDTKKSKKNKKVRNSSTWTVTLDDILESNNMFAEFYEYMNLIHAPPYLQFWMNVDSYKRFVKLELAIEDKHDDTSNQIDPIHSTHYTENQIATMRRDAFDVFTTHFGKNAKLYLPMEQSILDELATILFSYKIESSKDSEKSSITPELFDNAQKFVYRILNDIYFPKFLECKLMMEEKTKKERTGLGGWLFGKRRVTDKSRMNEIRKQIQEAERQKPAEKATVHLDIVSVYQHQTISRSESDNTLPTFVATIASGHTATTQKVETPLGGHLVKNIPTKRVIITPLPGTENIEAETKQDDVDIEPSLLKIQKRSSNNILFRIDMIDQGVVQDTYTKRSFNDFVIFHKLMSLSFSKTSNWPNLPGDIDITSDTHASNLFTEYMNLILSDPLLSQIDMVNEFLLADNLNFVDWVHERWKSGKNVHIEPPLHKSEVKKPKEKGKFLGALYELPKIIRRMSVTGPSKASEAETSLVTMPTLNENENIERDKSDITEPESTHLPLRGHSDYDLRNAPNIESNITAKRERENIQRIGSSINILTEHEVNLFLEAAFNLVEEIFDLKEKDRWLRRKLFQIFKELLKQAYGENIQRLLNEKFQDMTSEDTILIILKMIRDWCWPQGQPWNIFATSVSKSNEYQKSDDSNATEPPLPSEVIQIREEARQLWLEAAPDFMIHLLGRYNTTNGLNRMFNMWQYKLFNKKLGYSAIELILDLLSEEK